MKNLIRRITKKPLMGHQVMTIRHGVRITPHKFPWLRNLKHKILRALGLICIAVAAHSESLPIPVKINGFSSAISGSGVPVSPTVVSTPTYSFVTVTGVSQVIFAANANRIFAQCSTPSTNDGTVYLKWGSGATASNEPLEPFGTWWTSPTSISTQPLTAISDGTSQLLYCNQMVKGQ